jgi:hypothetical protein
MRDQRVRHLVADRRCSISVYLNWRTFHQPHLMRLPNHRLSLMVSHQLADHNPHLEESADIR